MFIMWMKYYVTYNLKKIIKDELIVPYDRIK